MVAKLIRLRPGNFALTEESAAEAVSESGDQAQGADVVRLPHYARHAKMGEAEPPPVSSLPIRSAERRRWSAELMGPGLAGLVLHGVGGIGAGGSSDGRTTTGRRARPATTCARSAS